MTVSLSPVGGAASQFFNSGGVPLYGGKIYTYEAGTTTPKATYTEANGLTAHPNPIILDSAGRVPSGEIWLTSAQAYLFILKTSSEELIGTYDNLYGIAAGAENAVTEVQVATAGQTSFVLTSMTYTPGVFTLGVYIDGVNQVVNNSYVETSATTVTFVSGLHVGAVVKFININSAATSSDLVTYLPAGTGAVATTVQAKLRESVSVKDFGAVGDGVADDTAAILAALTYLKPTGGKLNFPLGTYLTDQIDLTTFNNVELCGVTDSTEFPWNSPTVIKIRTACDVGIKTSQTGVEVPTTFGKMVTIKNLYINANSLAVVGVNCKASTKLTNVIVRYAASHGILFEGESYPVTLDHVVSQYNGGDGLRINPALTTVYSLSHCEFDYNSGNGLQILGGSTCVLNDVIAQGNTGSGFLIQMLDPSGFVNPIFLSALTFIGCYTEANGFYGLYVTSYNTNPATFTGKIPDLTFIGCSFNSGIGQQVYIRGTSTLKAISTGSITDAVVSPLYNTVNLDVEYMFTKLNLASGQIKFPATQNPSSDPNTIDDYKEGTWTPTATALTVVGTPTYAGSYTKIGRLVVATITITSTTSTESTHGNTSFTLPLSAAHDSALCNANTGSGIANAPGGFVTGSIVYSPTWAASNHVELSFSYFTA